MTVSRQFTLASLGALAALLLSCAPAFASGEFKLPDGRAWELVTPVNKLGASVALPGEEGGIDEASEAGNALAYDATSPPVSSVGRPHVGRRSHQTICRPISDRSHSQITTKETR